jgi:hypothetical protein
MSAFKYRVWVRIIQKPTNLIVVASEWGKGKVTRAVRGESRFEIGNVSNHFRN